MNRDYCRKCGRYVYNKTLDYSKRIYGEVYCFNCQKGKVMLKEDGTPYTWKPTPLKAIKDKSFIKWVLHRIF